MATRAAAGISLSCTLFADEREAQEDEREAQDCQEGASRGHFQQTTHTRLAVTGDKNDQTFLSGLLYLIVK